MEILRMIVFGFVIGVIARFLIPGPQPLGLIMTTLLGIAGSFLGGYLGHMFHGGQFMDAAQPAGWIGSTLGAILILLIYGFIRRRPQV